MSFSAENERGLVVSELILQIFPPIFQEAPSLILHQNLFCHGKISCGPTCRCRKRKEKGILFIRKQVLITIARVYPLPNQPEKQVRSPIISYKHFSWLIYYFTRIQLHKLLPIVLL